MSINEDAGHPAQKSHLFILRLWVEDLGNGKKDWRGKVQHVASGEVRYFRDWSTLENFMELLITQPRADPSDSSQQ